MSVVVCFVLFSQHEAHEEVRLDFNVDVKREGMRMEIQASEVLVGDILIVDKGDRVAADGVIYYSTGALASRCFFAIQCMRFSSRTLSPAIP